MMLADQGADVLKIDAPDHTFDVDERAIFDRGKRRIRLNLEAAKDRQTFLDLAADADVIIENFRPGTMARLGLDCTTLFERNPGLIFASLPGFSETDLERRDLAA
jgi:crotonobetainyl-CoA:carnitine CoA-transferase CaiB-like acyl-CoA transferase